MKVSIFKVFLKSHKGDIEHDMHTEVVVSVILRNLESYKGSKCIQ